MDVCDEGQAYSKVFFDVAMKNRKAIGINETGISREDCLECGEVIPEARREAVPGCTLCVKCQREAECR